MAAFAIPRPVRLDQRISSKKAPLEATLGSERLSLSSTEAIKVSVNNMTSTLTLTFQFWSLLEFPIKTDSHVYTTCPVHNRLTTHERKATTPPVA